MIYEKLTANERQIEVQIGCYADLPPLILFEESEMADIQLGNWAVKSLDFVAKTAAVTFALFHAYNSFRPWVLFLQIFTFMSSCHSNC